MTLNSITKKIIEKHHNLVMYVLPHSFRQILGRTTTSELDDYFFEICKISNVKSLIECGANEAAASVRANQIGIDAFAIEANPETYENVTPPSSEKFSKLNFGLGDRTGTLDFYIPKENHVAGSATFKPKPSVEYDVKNIPIKKLDELVKDTTYLNSNYALWIDVEGMQFEVLHGASETLKNKQCKIIKIETEDKELFKGQKWFTEDVIFFLEQLGYELVYRDFEYKNQQNLLFLKGDVMDTKLADRLFFKKTPIGTRDCIKNFLKEKQFKREFKALALSLFGEKIGNKLAAIAGSKSSKHYNKSV